MKYTLETFNERHSLIIEKREYWGGQSNCIQDGMIEDVPELGILDEEEIEALAEYWGEEIQVLAKDVKMTERALDVISIGDEGSKKMLFDAAKDVPDGKFMDCIVKGKSIDLILSDTVF